jgi:16S rRNA (guanine966-N2)-methyltransferase
MQIIAGIRKGKKLIRPQGLGIRPTSDKVKQFIFNYLDDRIVDSVMLDLCAGTGNIGIEALSRGAQEVIFVDNDKTAIQLINKNIQLTHFQNQAQVLLFDAVRYLKKSSERLERFDIIFIDPPYQDKANFDILMTIDKLDLLSESAIVVLEHGFREALEISLAHLKLIETRRLGDSAVSFYSKVK